MNILINYANNKYKCAQRQNTWTGKHIAGFDKVYEFGPEDIGDDYRQAHADIFAESRGNGLWLWKPYFINKVLSEVNEGDRILYCDAGAFFIASAKPIFDILDRESVFVTDYPLLEINFTKKFCLEYMDCNTYQYTMTNQISATYLGFKCDSVAKNFVSEWLKLCENKALLAPEKNENCEVNSIYQFVAHREDQSILSLLCKKKKIIPHRDLTQRGRMPYTYFCAAYAFQEPKHNDTYKTILFSHKMPKFKLMRLVKYIVLCKQQKKKYRTYIKRIGK